MRAVVRHGGVVFGPILKCGSNWLERIRWPRPRSENEFPVLSSSSCQFLPVRDCKTGLGGSSPRNGLAGETLEILIINER